MGYERYKWPRRPVFLTFSSSRSVHCAQRPTGGFLLSSERPLPDEEGPLVHELANLPFRPFDFHGYLATRQVVSFGDRCDYDRRAVVEASPFPSFLVFLRNKIAAIFYRSAEIFRQVLINEYRPGAGIGWHHDKAQFDEVVGLSLLAPCVLRFRQKAGETWDRESITSEQFSVYLLSGAARTAWEHTIPAFDHLRYSITLRTLVAKAPSGEEGT